MRKILICILLLVAVHFLPARESSLAMGFQAGFTTTGSIVDMQTDLLNFSIGFNVPLGYAQAAYAFDVDPQVSPYWFYTLSGDVTFAFTFDENLFLKAGVGAIALTNFGPRITAVIGPVFKAEYWVWESNSALFVSVLVPTKRFELEHQVQGPPTRRIYSVPGLAEEWLFTSSIGMLYGY